MLFCYVETLRKFKASKENSQQIESIRRNEIENYLILTIICFITVYCVLILPFLLVNTIDSNMKTIPVWTHGLARYLEMSSYTVLTQILYFIQCSTGKCFELPYAKKKEEGQMLEFILVVLKIFMHSLQLLCLFKQSTFVRPFSSLTSRY